MRIKLDYYPFYISSVHFTVYIDELLERLKRSGCGCHRGHILAIVFGYEDHITLSAPTKSFMSRLLCITQKINAENSYVLYYLPPSAGEHIL